MPRKPQSGEYYQDIPFPIGGVYESLAYHRQKPLTTVGARNVRPFDPSTGRLRGGQRHGLVKHASAVQYSAGNSIQDINSVVTAGSGGTTMSNTRVITTLVASGGSVYAVTGGAAISSALSSTAPVVFSADLLGVMYYTDGATYLKITPPSTAATWAADNGGTLPTAARLICSWGGRIVLAGVRTDAHNYFMSAVDDPLNFNYAPTTIVSTSPFVGNSSDAGKVGDVINTLIPWADDLLIFGCDHSIYQMTGNPRESGRVDRISDTIGMAWGRPWCKDHVGTIYFFGSRGGVYKLTLGGGSPELISQSIHERLCGINLATKIVTMAWDDRQQGLHVFASSITAAGAEVHYWYDGRSDSWWIDTFATNNHNPKCVHIFDADAPDDRNILIGSWDSYVRYFSRTATSDDSTAISSYVLLGPIMGDAFNQVKMQAILAIMDGSSLTWEVFTGLGAQQAFDSASAAASGTLADGRNDAQYVDRTGTAMYLKLSQNTAGSNWAMEAIQAELMTMGPTLQRQAV